jgi:dynactin-4
MFTQKTSQGRDDVSNLLPSLSRQLSISEDPRPVNVKLTGEVILPSSSVLLPPRDDAAEYDDSGDTCHFQDNPKYVYDDAVISLNIFSFLPPTSL